MTAGLRFSFTLTVLVAFALVYTLGTAAVVLVFRDTGQAAAVATAEQNLAQSARLVAARSRAMLSPVLLAASVLPQFRPLLEPWGADGPLPDAIAAFAALLAQEPAVQAVNVGLPDGTQRRVLRLATLSRDLVAVPPGASLAAYESPGTGSAAPARWVFLDDAGQAVGGPAGTAAGASARSATWYLQATRPGVVHVSPLYDLDLFGQPGLSVSSRLPDGAGVLGLDIILSGMSAFLAAQRVSPQATLFLMDANGLLLAHQDSARAVQRLGDDRITWLSLSGSTDPLLQGFWAAYAQGLLAPGSNARLALGEETLLVRIEPLADLAGAPLLAVVVAPLDDFTGPMLAGVRRGTLLALVTLIVGLAAIALLASRVSRPLERLTREAEAIRGFDLAMPLRLDSRIAEVQRLGGAMTAMKAALANFGAYVPRDLVRQLVSTGEAAVLGGDRRPLTVMFTDVEGFTTLAEKLESEEVMQITSAYFEALTRQLLADGATIDKYIGDAVMALWNAPLRQEDHPARACFAALRARQVSMALEADFEARGWPRLRTRIGVHSGEAVVGNVGSSDRLSYTAIGTMVNIASRLEGMNKLYGTTILVSEATRQAAGQAFVCRAVDLVQPKGARTPIEIFELLGLAAAGAAQEPALAPPAAVLAGLAAWSLVVADYRAGRFAEALAGLRALPGGEADPLHAAYAARLTALLAGPPGPGWSPIIRQTEK